MIATAGDTVATIAWNAVAAAASYNIYWSTTPGVTTERARKCRVPQTRICKRGLANGTAYYYIVTASTRWAKASLPLQVTATPAAAPRTAQSRGAGQHGGDTQLVITWAPAAGAASYNLYWSTAPGSQLRMELDRRRG